MLRQIRYFQAVVKCRSFTEAAAECCISQSAISQHVQALEQELGVKLLERGNRRFTLTPAGEHFYRKSLVLAADWERLRRETVRIARGDAAELRVGYLRGYGGLEFQQAVAAFSEACPAVSLQIVTGNHEELYDALRDGRADLILSDQRRAFSDEYVNRVLTESRCCIELPVRDPLASCAAVDTGDLKPFPCILIASPNQQETERAYYQQIVGMQGDFRFAETLEEARLLVLSGKGFLPVDGVPPNPSCTAALRRVPLTRRGKPVWRNYCAFWKADNSGYYVETFADILQAQFPATP